MALQENGAFAKRFCNAMSMELQLEHINAYNNYTKPQNIDKLIEGEMQRLRTHHSLEEDAYAEQMLLQNPVIVERRTIAGPSSSSDDTIASSRSSLQHRSNSCRKSRINNKVKKAKTKFRHEYMTNKLKQSAQHLQYIRNLIEHTEMQLIYAGFSQDDMLKMRSDFGLDRCGEHNAAIAPYMPHMQVEQ